MTPSCLPSYHSSLTTMDNKHTSTRTHTHRYTHTNKQIKYAASNFKIMGSWDQLKCKLLLYFIMFTLFCACVAPQEGGEDFGGVTGMGKESHQKHKQNDCIFFKVKAMFEGRR